jgi:hypothetical protein
MALVHGHPDDDLEWTLEATSTVQERKEKKDAEAGEEGRPKVCPKCFCMFSKRPDCPNCGFKPRKKSKDVKVKPGRLQEMVASGEMSEESAYEQKLRLWKRCMGICIGKDLPMKNAAGMYRSQTGNWPSQDGLDDLPRGSDEWHMQARDFYEKVKQEKEAQEV